MATHRTALGKTVDMAALAAKHERTRAVGNMKVNARGDTIDSNGKIIQPVTAKVNKAYASTVGNRSAQPTKSAPPQRPQVDALLPAEELSAVELELEAELEDDIEVEEIKAKEVAVVVTKKDKKK